MEGCEGLVSSLYVALLGGASSWAGPLLKPFHSYLGLNTWAFARKSKSNKF